MHALSALGTVHVPVAFFVLNIDPIFLHLGPISVHWYGLAYVVAICAGLFMTLKFTHRVGIHEDQVWGLFIWTAIAGLIGGRLYYVVQQPDLVNDYLLKPINILAVWNGGMAFFGAIFCASATLFLLAPRYGINPFIALDGGALFAVVGQIFGRFGNIINGDILGYAVTSGAAPIPGDTCAHAPCLAYVSNSHILSWAVVYLNPHSFAPLGIAYQPAPVYEIGMDLIILAILFPLRYRLPRVKAGVLFSLYVALYAVSQFVVFFYRGSEPYTPFLGINGLKQAQWTGIAFFLGSIVLLALVWRFSRPWPYTADDPAPLPAALGERYKTQALSLPDGPDHSAPATPARATGNDASSGESSASAGMSNLASAVDLPAWVPSRPSGGGLRNVFTNPRTPAIGTEE